jgi:hypothetical protein
VELGAGRNIILEYNRAEAKGKEFVWLKSDGIAMADRFLVIWFDDGTPIVTPHPTSAEAFQRAKELFQQHGQDIEIEIHLNEMGSILFNKQRMHTWCHAGYPPIQVAN